MTLLFLIHNSEVENSPSNLYELITSKSQSNKIGSEPMSSPTVDLDKITEVPSVPLYYDMNSYEHGNREFPK